LLAVELDTLRALQPYPGRSDGHDRQFAPPRWSAIIDWAARMARSRGSAVTLYPEIKEPSALARRDSDPVPAFIESVTHLPDNVIVWVQCFEAEPLRRVHDATGLPCALLLDSRADWRMAIKANSAWLARAAVSKKLLTTGNGQDSGVVEAAHAAGLRVDAWTFRDDSVGEGYANVEDELVAAMRLGIDGLFCDFPATGLAARKRLEAGD
jgi:glycerophosphoryl diester phosphodiesterase